MDAEGGALLVVRFGWRGVPLARKLPWRRGAYLLQGFTKLNDWRRGR